MTRQQKFKEDGVEPSMPPAGPAAYLVSYLLEVGPAMVAGMGRGPITWQEMEAWQRTTGTTLQAWEGRLLRRLSHDYIGTVMDATDPGFPPPYSDELTPSQREIVAQKVRSVFKGWGQQQQNKVH